MSRFMLFVVMFGLEGIATALLFYILSYKKMGTVSEKIRGLKLFPYFVIVYYSVFCLYKTIFGKGLLGYHQTFDLMDNDSVKHWGFVAAAVFIAYLVLYFVIFKKDKFIQFVELNLSGFVGITIVLYSFFIAKPVNWRMSIPFVVSFIAALILIRKKSDYKYVALKNIKSRLALGGSAVLLWSLMSFVILPVETYLSNANDIYLVFKTYLLSCISSAAAAAFVVLALLIIFCSERIYELSCVGIFAVTLIGYIQEMFLNGKLYSMDGNVQDWDINKKIINAVIWIIVFSACIVIAAIKRKSTNIVIYASIFIIAVRLVTVIVMGISTEVDNHTYLTTDGSLTVAEGDNVIVFVLDWYDTQVLDKIVAETPDFTDALSDFTYYDNAMSKYAYTQMSIPYLLSGVEWKDGMKESDYHEYAFDQDNLISQIKDAGWNVGVYTSAANVGSNIVEYAENCTTHPIQEYSFDDIRSNIIKITKYKTMPFFMKNDYFYSSADIANLSNNVDIWNTSTDVYYHDQVFNQGISVDSSIQEQGAFRFIHLVGAHGEYTMNENGEAIETSVDDSLMVGQAKGCMKIVFEYIKQLKELGVYDNSTIVITADHGQNLTFDEEHVKNCAARDLDYPSSPIMFVKEKNQHNDTLEYNDQPVIHDNLIETVRKATTGTSDKSQSIKPLEELDENDNKSRIMDVFRYNEIPLKEYEVTGNVHDWNNWKLINSEEQ